MVKILETKGLVLILGGGCRGKKEGCGKQLNFRRSYEIRKLFEARGWGGGLGYEKFQILWGGGGFEFFTFDSLHFLF